MKIVKSSFIDKAKPAPRGWFSNFWRSQLLVLLVGLGFLIIIAVPLVKNYARQRAVANEIAGIQKEITDFKSQNQDLTATLSYLQSNDSLEEQARLNLGLKKPGEKVVVVQAEATSSPDSDNNQDGSVSNWWKWWQYFFKH